MKRPGTYRIGYRVKRPNKFYYVAAILLASLSLYGLFVTNPPSFAGVGQTTYAQSNEDNPQIYEPKSVSIPSLGVEFAYQTGDTSVLESGGWHRYPERGEPGTGNFILAAHRYRTGVTPGDTQKKSLLYHIDKLSLNDTIVVTNESSQVYTYQVTELFEVSPNDIQIESLPPTGKHYLTLYSCTLGGVHDGRVVVRAQLVP